MIQGAFKPGAFKVGAFKAPAWTISLEDIVIESRNRAGILWEREELERVRKDDEEFLILMRLIAESDDGQKLL